MNRQMGCRRAIAVSGVLRRTLSSGILRRSLCMCIAAFLCFAVVISVTPDLPAYALSSADFADGESPFYIYVEKGSHTMTVFGKDAHGHYTIPLRTFPTATGRASRMTPTGIFKKGGTEAWHSWGRSYSPYASSYYPGLYVHGPLYQSRSFPSLYGNTVTQIGTNATSGCLRTTVEASYFVYEYCPAGTTIHIVNGSPIGFYAEKPEISPNYSDPANSLTLADILPEYQAMLDRQAHLTTQKQTVSQVKNVSVDKDSARLIPGNRSSSSVDTGGYYLSSELTLSAVAEKQTGQTGQAGQAEQAGQTGQTVEQAGEPVMWLSDELSVAAVSFDGVVKASDPGYSRVTALSTDGLSSGTCVVRVISTGKNGAAANPDATAEAASPGFADVSALHWAYRSISRLAEDGIIAPGAAYVPQNGGEAAAVQSLFRPGDDITSAEFIKMLLTATDMTGVGKYDMIAGAAVDGSADNNVGVGVGVGVGVSGSAGVIGTGAQPHWFDKYYGTAAALGVVNETDRLLGAFDTDFLTRAKAAVYIARAGWFDNKTASSAAAAVNESAVDGVYLPDIASLDGETKQAVTTAAARGFLNAYSDGQFRPDGYMTRAEAAIIICNMVENYV